MQPQYNWSVWRDDARQHLWSRPVDGDGSEDGKRQSILEESSLLRLGCRSLQKLHVMTNKRHGSIKSGGSPLINRNQLDQRDEGSPKENHSYVP